MIYLLKQKKHVIFRSHEAEKQRVMSSSQQGSGGLHKNAGTLAMLPLFWRITPYPHRVPSWTYK